jgi:ABC-type transport system involved in multi-copper enzyme maturation permease subunit
MRRRRAEFVAVARLETREVLRSRWLLASGLIYAALALVFALAASRESTVLGFTGTGRLLLSFAHALLLVLPLVALAATAQTLNRAREDGTIEFLFGHPVSAAGYYDAITAVRFALLVAPLGVLLVLIPTATHWLYGDPIPWLAVGRTAVLAAGLLWCFAGIGLALSAHVTGQARSAILVLVVWAVSVALADFALIGLLLTLRLHPQSIFALAVLNPVESVRMALLSGQDPDLAAFGPVGFYLAQHLGGRALFAIGLAWPVAAGTAAWWLGRRRFVRGDLV